MTAAYRAPVRVLLLLAVFTMPIAGSAAGQAAAPEGLQPLTRFHSWVGDWRGSGWSMDRSGRRIDFNLMESVALKADGKVLLIEGHGSARGDSAFTTHNGVALVYWDEHSSRYRWNGHEARSGSVDAEVTPLDNGLTWSIPAGPAGGSVRFTIQYDQARWREWGEASANGTEWSRFMEIDLGRVKAD